MIAIKHEFTNDVTLHLFVQNRSLNISFSLQLIAISILSVE